MKNSDLITEETVYQECLKQLLQLSELGDQVSVLANLFVQLGLGKMDIEQGPVQMVQVPAIVNQDIKRNGETLENSLVRQGLILLSWIEKE